ncbi:MAG: V-type ATP synthase subunit D, partial [Desulfurococcales archaeon]|nr:V-type ATP synthase subunit D [Desulfurococcales archaeon]
SPYLVDSLEMMKSILPNLMKLAELEETLRLLIKELKETQRLINAIDYVILPSYEKVTKFINMVLEERMREEFIRLKLLKRKLERREEAAS